jgi:hypothetical protein
MRKDISEMKATLNQTKGGVQVLLSVASIGGIVGAGIVKVVAFLKGA